MENDRLIKFCSFIRNEGLQSITISSVDKALY